MHIPANASSFGSGIFPANVWGAKHNSPIDRLSAVLTRKRKAQRTSINTDTDAEEALHRRIDEYEID
jgi:hypothetical protein